MKTLKAIGVALAMLVVLAFMLAAAALPLVPFILLYDLLKNWSR